MVSAITKTSSDTDADVVRVAAEILTSSLATDIVVLDVSHKSDYANRFVICSGETERHLKYLLKRVADALEKRGVKPDHVEGHSEGGWLLMDYGTIVIHLFTAAQREHYKLEALWGGEDGGAESPPPAPAS